LTKLVNPIRAVGAFMGLANSSSDSSVAGNFKPNSKFRIFPLLQDYEIAQQDPDQAGNWLKL
jgi:hypothetical protein